ncbi:reverse transcriptase domain-containing protein, partial [Tanacetum coccineum]
MTKKDEEKTAFHTEEGVFCYTKMPFGLKNAGATYQRLVDSAFKEQIGVNLEAYVDDMVIMFPQAQDAVLKGLQRAEAAGRSVLERRSWYLSANLTTPERGGDPDMMYWPQQMKQVSADAPHGKDTGGQLPYYTYVSDLCKGRKQTYALMEKLHGPSPRGFYGADTPTEISATAEVPNNPRVEDIPEPSNARGYLTLGPKAWRLYTDGASNNEGSRAVLILIVPDDVEYSYALRLNVSNSNNDAEYEALLAGLRIDK